MKSETRAGTSSTAAHSVEADESAAPVVLQPIRASGSPWLRRLGNGLIAAGLLLMIGVGGYLGIQTYTNSQEAQQIKQNHDVVQGLNLGPAGTVPTQAAGTADSSNPAPPAPLFRLVNGASLKRPSHRSKSPCPVSKLIRP